MARTKKQLENLLLVKTANRFRKTKLSKIESHKRETAESLFNQYVIEVSGFKLKLFFAKDVVKNLESYSLWIQKPDGYLFETFESDNENYAPVLKKMYENIITRIANSQKKDEKKEEKEIEKKLRRLDRII
jgi:hypothetical protein